MDFIVNLPRTERGHDVIWVVVDRLTKMSKIIPTESTVIAHNLAYQFINDIF